MKSIRRIAAAIVTIGLAASAWGQSYPSRPVRLVTGTQSGGLSTILARVFGEELAKRIGQPVIVEDKPGASGIIAAKLVMSAPADGYTLHVGGINPHPLLESNGVDLLKAMEPVGIVSSVPMVFITSPNRPLDSVRAVAEYAAAHPGRLDFGSSSGNYWNLMMKLFARRAGGFSYTNVPYKGSGDIQIALTRGDIQITMLTPPSVAPMVAAGSARAIMIAAPTRSPLLPNVPTSTEVGLRSFTASSNMYLWAPKGTPRDVINKLNAAMVAVANSGPYIEAIKEKTGTLPLALSPEETRAHFSAEVQQLGEAVKESGPLSK